MAVDYTPSAWVTGIVVSDGTYCQIPWSELGAANVAESDIRNILRGLADTIKDSYDALPAIDVPTKFNSTKNTRYNDSEAEFEEKHGWTFDLTVDSTSLASE